MTRRPVDDADVPEVAGRAEEAEAEPEEAVSERRAFVVSAAQHGVRLDRLLTQVAPEFSRSHLQSLVEDGHVMLDAVPAKSSSTRVKAGQRGEVELVRPAHELAFVPEAMALQVVYEDAHILVLDKPAGLVVHPAAGNWSGTLLNGLLARDAQAARLPRAGIVHRLDKDTSGLMVVGRTLEAVTHLVRAIAARTVHRQYLAVAQGRVEPRARSIEAPIGRDPKVRVRMAVVAGAKPARTDVERLAFRDGYSALRCTLHTGRTHQIRVHLSQAGHPLVGDALYGGRPALGMTRQALHAHRLAFDHPAGGTPLEFVAEPPEDFSLAWKQVTDR